MDKADPSVCLAARFAAKEATAKALGAGFGAEFGWLDSEVCGNWPSLSFNKRKDLLQSKGANKALISLTHLESVAVQLLF